MTEKTFVRLLIFFARCFLLNPLSQLGRTASTPRITRESNMWIEVENHPAQWGGLDGKKNSSYGRSIFSLTPFVELNRSWDGRL
ncbi:MAG: hypothetical protein WBV48_11610, partial [Candidatus Acidiferrales bacterium]